jgi:hypothetical protein
MLINISRLPAEKVGKGVEFRLREDFRRPCLYSDPEELRMQDAMSIQTCHPWSRFIGQGLWYRKVGSEDSESHAAHSVLFLSRLFGRGSPSSLAFGGSGVQLGPVLFCQYLCGSGRFGSSELATQDLSQVMLKNPGDVLALTNSAFFPARVTPGSGFPLRAWAAAATVFGTSEAQKAKVAFTTYQMTSRDGSTWFVLSGGGRTSSFQWGSSGGFEVELRHYVLPVSASVSRHLVLALQPQDSTSLAAAHVLVGYTASPDLGNI